MRWGALFGIATAVVAGPVPGLSRVALAQDVADADTLPKNVGGLIIRPGLLLGGGGLRFGHGWRTDRESFLADFDDLNLSSVLAGDNAGALNALLGDLGTTRFQATQTGIAVGLMAAYGITDRWTVAAVTQFQYSSYAFEAWLQGSQPEDGELPLPRANWAVKDPKAITCPGGQFRLDSPEDLQQILEQRDPPYEFNISDLRKAFTSDCLDYLDPIDNVVAGSDGNPRGKSNRTHAGFRDLILASKYKFYHGRDIQLAAIGYVVVPTGKTEDPRDLFNIRFGDGTWNAALLLGTTIPLGKLRVFGSAGYERVFADTRVRRLRALNFSEDLEYQLARGQLTEQELFDRVDEGSAVPIVTKYDQAEVTRKLGDNIYVYSGVGYEIFEWLNVGLRFDFWHHFRDQITSIGPRFDGTPAYKTEAQIRAEVDALVADGTVVEDTPECFEDDARTCKTKELSARLRDSEGRRKIAYGWHTVRGQLIGGLAVGFNTLGPFLRDEFPLPLIASISVSRFLAGNNIDITDQVGLSLIIPLPFGDVKDPAEYGFDGEEGGGLPFP